MVAEEIFVTLVGAVAAATLRASTRGRVAALFDSSFYVELDNGWACIGTAGLPMGPINVRSEARSGTSWANHGVRLDDPVNVVGEMIRVGNGIALSLAPAKLWQPPPAPRWNDDTLRDGLHRIDTDAFPPGLRGLPERTARAAIDALSAEILSDRPLAGRPMQAVQALMGLGPGLTPSGDDFLCGMMIALAAIGEEARAEELYDGIAPLVRQRTNAISSAHLAAAGGGAGIEALHHAIDDILQGREASLEALDAIGHTSGRDALAGALAVLRVQAGRAHSVRTYERIEIYV